MNEGLPYVAGGGGSGSATLGNSYTDGINAYAAAAGASSNPKIAAGAGEAGIAGILTERAISLATSLNKFPDCSGTAFIYKQIYSGKDLIAELVRTRGLKRLTFTSFQSQTTSSI